MLYAELPSGVYRLNVIAEAVRLYMDIWEHGDDAVAVAQAEHALEALGLTPKEDAAAQAHVQDHIEYDDDDSWAVASEAWGAAHDPISGQLW